MIKNLITIAENFIGTKGFRNFYQNDKDILNNGGLSCAIFVSTVLVICRLVDRVYFTVNNLSKHLEENIHFETIVCPENQDIQIGDIIVWDALSEGDHKHIGFCVSEGIAVSNRSKRGAPGKHKLIYTGFDKNHKKGEAKILKIHRLKNPS